MIDFGGAGDLGMVGDVAMGEFAAYYVWVLGESCVG